MRRYGGRRLRQKLRGKVERSQAQNKTARLGKGGPGTNAVFPGGLRLGSSVADRGGSVRGVSFSRLSRRDGNPLSRLRERVRVRARLFDADSGQSLGFPHPSPLPQAGEGAVTASGRGAKKKARVSGPSYSWSRTEASTALHRSKELVVALRVLHLVEHEFHRAEFIHRMQQLAQDPDLLQQVRFDQQLFAARAGAVDVDRRDRRAFRRCGGPGALPCCRCP